MKLLKSIRFDPSDTFVFDNAAEPGEWAIPGSFSFASAAEGDISGKQKQAFSNGFLSLQSFGHSTFVSVANIGDTELASVEARLAGHLMDCYGAPSLTDALAAAKSELAFAIDICADVPINTVFTLRRHFDEDGAIREELRILETSNLEPPVRVFGLAED